MWSQRPEPTYLQIIAPADRGDRLQEGRSDDGRAETVESIWNANRSGHWATAALLAFAVPWGLLRILALCGLIGVI